MIESFLVLLLASFGVGGWFVWKHLVLRSEQRAEAGYIASDGTLGRLVGKDGTAVTALRPAGTAIIEGRRVDVVSESEYITGETSVTVVAVEGGRVVVRPSDVAHDRRFLGK